MCATIVKYERDTEINLEIKDLNRKFLAVSGTSVLSSFFLLQFLKKCQNTKDSMITHFQDMIRLLKNCFKFFISNCMSVWGGEEEGNLLL